MTVSGPSQVVGSDGQQPRTPVNAGATGELSRTEISFTHRLLGLVLVLLGEAAVRPERARLRG